MKNTTYRQPLPNSDLNYFNARQAINDIAAGAYEKLPYTSRVLAENLIHKADKVDGETLTAWLSQLIDRKHS